MNDMHLIAIEAEARRYCDEHEIKSYETFQHVYASMRHQAFRKAIEPYIQQKVRIHNLRLVDHIKVNADGSLGETIYKPFAPEIVEALRLIDEAVAAEAERWGFSERRSGGQ